MEETQIHPKDVANKASKANLLKAVDMALAVESDAVRLNTQTFNANRYKAVARLSDYDALKDEARSIKEEAIKDLPRLVEIATHAVEKRGGHVFFARTKEEATKYVRDVCKKHSAKLVVKAKSITSEEIGLNAVLERDGIAVAETDLAEFILQVSKEQPSHIVAPAIHRSRERISELFREHFESAQGLDTGEKLTAFARDILREKFLAADVGISGANLVGAEEGAILLVESEGNIRLTTHLPAVHIAIAGIEKIVPSKKDFGPFIELLAASGTGQPLSTYTNVLEPPLPLPVLNLNGRSDTQREFHLVLVDNGRMTMRKDEELRETLYCIRCSACMNVCANFQAVGGHAFGGECYTGGIGGAWTIGTSGRLENGRFAELCTGCSRCIPNCPIRINIPRLNTVIKHRLLEAGEPRLQKTFFGYFSTLARLASLLPSFSNWACRQGITKTLLELTIGADRRRSIPPFAVSTLTRRYRAHRPAAPAIGQLQRRSRKLMLFGDVFTQYNNPQVGMAVVSVFEKLGFDVELGKVLEDGRAALSQGMIPTARKSAARVVAYLEPLVSTGYDLLFAEPSVLAMMRQEYCSLVPEPSVAARIGEHCFDPVEYLNRLLDEGIVDANELRGTIKNEGTMLFYHGHCQLKSIGAGNAAPLFFERMGFRIDVSTAECCGMAGSFGYKKQYYALSKNVGEDLGKQIDGTVARNADIVVLASGTSCREQIRDIRDRTALHPIEFLDSVFMGDGAQTTHRTQVLRNG